MSCQEYICESKLFTYSQTALTDFINKPDHPQQILLNTFRFIPVIHMATIFSQALRAQATCGKQEIEEVVKVLHNLKVFPQSNAIFQPILDRMQKVLINPV